MAKSQVLVHALAGVIALSMAGTTPAAPPKEKCYGIANAGKNDCAANGHTCAAQATADKDPKEWKYVAKGSCLKMGGTLTDTPTE